LRGKRTIELGCGVGLATVLALAGGATVLATDHYEAALDFTAYNARTNVDLEPETSLLDWRTPYPEGIGTFDMVFAADVLYERKNTAALADLVPKLLAQGGEAIIADPHRDEASTFLEAMERHGFADTVEDATVEQDNGRVKVLLHQMWRQAPGRA